ncbi:MAG: hypothetical protein PHZ04_03080 [Patescibacteria group bacterium]|nr:hypothetical protein [Patescibacteria group bacterium]MDD5294700.1 hypothetical protein [Patescibacteria group bacterium]MDD5554685.1 hypothetical protein [Patescibacteria group bacterium]
MLNPVEVFEGTDLAEFWEIFETEDFVEPETPQGKNDRVIRVMTLLEKALFTAEKRAEKSGKVEQRIAFHLALWDLAIKPKLPKEQRNKPLFIRAGFVIVENPEEQPEIVG